MASSKPHKLFANRHFLYLWANQMLTQTAFYLVTFSLAIWVFELMRVNIAVSLWLLAFLIPSVTLSVFAGVLADTYDRRKVMLAANFLWGGTILCYILAKKSFPLILLITAVVQGIDEFFLPAQNASLPQLVPKRELLFANSLFSLSMYGAAATGFVLAGPMLRFLGFSATFVSAAFLTFAGATFVHRLPSIEPGGSVKTLLTRSPLSYLKQEVRSGALFYLRSPRIRNTALFLALLTAGGVAAGALAPGFMEQSLGIDAKDISLVGGIPICLGLIVGTMLIRKLGDQWDEEKLVRRGLFVAGLGALVLALIPALRFYLVSPVDQLANKIFIPQAFEHLPYLSLVVGALILILGIAVTFVIIPTITSLQRVTPNRMRGRVFGFLNSGAAVLQGLAALALGAAADLLTPPPLIAVAGILALVFAFHKERCVGWIFSVIGKMTPRTLRSRIFAAVSNELSSPAKLG